MLDRNFVRQNADIVRKGLERKRMNAPLDEFLTLDTEWRTLRTAMEANQAEMNRVSKSIGTLMAQGDKDGAERAKAEASELKQRVAAAESTVAEIEAKLNGLELLIPNVPHESVPDGAGEADNKQVHQFAAKPEFAFEPKPHWDIATNLDIVDFAAGAKISGSGFIVYKGMGARLQRALINFMLEFHVDKHAYIEIYPPYLVNRATMTGTGQLPKFEEDLYRIESDDLFLIPTAEVPVTNIHSQEILDANQLPIRYAAFSGCFRREAGAAGKDTRGLLRVHQFDKVELVKIVSQESSFDELESLRRNAEEILEALGLHYRTMEMCAAELGYSNCKQYDLEVWSPGVGKYLEVSSASNFGDFQARRADIRYRPEAQAKPVYAHTLNASGVACPRLMSAVLETYQQEDGSVFIPAPLQKFMGTDKITA
ncbi:MAG: serine--tRNA ligase [Fimbriimonadales bacterium]